MPLLRFQIFQAKILKAFTFFSILMSALIYAGHAESADVTLAWDGISQSGVTVTGYRVYYSTDSSSGLTEGCEVASTSCTVSGLGDGQTYHFVATAYNSYGESEPSDPVSYKVPDVLQTFTITASADSYGSISPSGTLSLTEGQSETFTITPNSGFHIKEVLVDGADIGASSQHTFSEISANHMIHATFASNPVTLHTIVASDDGHGGISPKGNVTVIEGNNQKFTITPISGYHIADVRVDGQSVGKKSEYEFSHVTGPHTISANFAANMFTITATAGSNGSISPGTVSVAQGSGKTFTIAANSGYEIADVVVDNQSQGVVTSYTFNNIVGNHTIAATFDAVTAVVPTDDDPSGSSDTSIDSSSTGAGNASGSSGTLDSTDSTTAANPSGSSSTSASNGSTTDNNSSIVSPAVTPAQEFVNQAPNPPSLLYPVDGVQDVSLTPLLEIEGFMDLDADDDHGATRWQMATDGNFKQLILDITIDRSHTNNYLVNLLVPHGTLCNEQLYYWRASVKDAREDDSKWSNWSEVFTFMTAAKVQADANANGVSDDKEPAHSDLDNDGLNDNDQPLMRVYKSRSGQSLIGINAVEGVSHINCFTSVEPESIPDEPRPKLRYGLMVFNVTLDQIGGTARFELYVPEKPRVGAKWYKYDPINGWYKFPVDNDGDKYYVEITDGGFGDADGVVNGIIVDPIGLAEVSSDLESVDAIDTAGSDDSESTMDNLKNACFIQATLDRSSVETTDTGVQQMAVFRFIYSGFLVLGIAVAVITLTGGRRVKRTHSSFRSNGRSRSA